MDDKDGLLGPASSGRLGPNRRTGRGTLVVAFVALIVAAAALAVGGLALARSGASSTADGSPPSLPQADLSANPGTDTGGSAASISSNAAAQPDGANSSIPSAIDPGAAFSIAYQDQPLTIRSPACRYSNSMTVDLDAPRINPSDGTQEIGYSGCTPGSISTGLPFAQLASSTSGPKDCLQQIQTNLGVSPIAPSNGLTLCFVTDKAEATSEGIPQKIVIMNIESVSSDGVHGILYVSLTAWKVPN